MQDIREQLKIAIKNLYNLDFDPDVTPSPENITADYSTNAPLKLAKLLGKNPMDIAEALRKNVFEEHNRRRGDYGATEARNDGPEGAFREDIFLSAPGFLNFILSDEYLKNQLENQNFTTNKYNDKTIICEFSDPNPFKVLHVGHLYTSIMGDAISRLYENAGARVIRANFGGDVGLHVAKTLYVLQNHEPDFTIEDIAKCYVEGTAEYDEDESAKAKITELNKEIYQINANNVHGTKLADYYWRGRELSYQYFDDFYASIGVKFDKYYPESTVAALGLETVKKQLQNGVYQMSEGAVVFKGEDYGLHTRVFINKEGVPTYEAKDVGLIFTKDHDYHFDKSVVITGSEQKDYMAVVLKSVEQYAPELVEKTTHLTHGLVKLPGNVKMSSRKGNFLKAVDVLDLVREALKQEYDSKDEKVALAATKYAFLKYKMGGDIIFDPHESVKMTGNSGPYLLYSCVRAKKILESVNGAFEEHNRQRGDYGATEACDDRPEGAFRKSAITDFEKNLIKKILEYNSVLAEATDELAPHKLANYLYDLAQTFSRFYENCPVVGSPEEQSRAKLVSSYLATMTHGLNLLGIEIPEKM